MPKPEVGCPRAAPTKVPLTVHDDQKVVDARPSGGPGWQSRINDALRDRLRHHLARNLVQKT
ncbi:MAG: hypothetical protein E2576_10875 [Alcaligenaceae bacterium]|nr:hypothetical protein [Alcaligenaceae bacterium SAGV5]MPS55292.1 hypothetical protein [Alcaligenaceae bacterium SAGV3]MPT57215.1 hypothetical protein [Alcaligenaceae bacterium]